MDTLSTSLSGGGKTCFNLSKVIGAVERTTSRGVETSVVLEGGVQLGILLNYEEFIELWKGLADGVRFDVPMHVSGAAEMFEVLAEWANKTVCTATCSDEERLHGIETMISALDDIRGEILERLEP